MKNQIISDPKILSGKPVIAGTRISVELILDRFAAGMTEESILADYPHLTPTQIQAALAYAGQIVAQKSKPSIEDAEPTSLFTHEISR